MGADASAKLAFGVEFPKHVDLPWSDESDVGVWWAYRNGMPTYETFQADPSNSGKNYYVELRRFKEKNVCPVDYCWTGFSGETILYLVPGTYSSSTDWGSRVLDADKLIVNKKALQAFLDFFEKYGIELPQKPSWILSVYYG